MRVELQDIYKYFGPIHANAGISMTFEPGRIYAVLGENGAGKSTLMKILSGYQPPTSGIIRLNGRPVSFQSPIDALQSGIGMMYQDPADFPPLHVVENHLLAYDERLALQFGEAKDILHGYARRFGFTVDPEAYVDSLTLGERQQLELLRLLALGAEVLILDEPTTGISAEQKEVLFNTLRRLSHEESKTIILVSHKLEEVQELCDEVAVLRRGKLVGTRSMPAPTPELVRLMFGEDVLHIERRPLEPGEIALEVVDASISSYRLSVENINLEMCEGEVLGLAGLEGSGQRELLQACAGLLPLRSGEIIFDGEPLRGKASPFHWVRWLALTVLIVRIAWAVFERGTGQITIGSLVFDIIVGLLQAGLVWLIGEILIAWTSESPYHEFQRRGGAYVPAGRLEEGLVPGLSLTEHMALVSPEQGLMVDWQHARSAIQERIKRFNIIGQPDTAVDALSGGNQQRAMLALLRAPLRLLLLEHPTRGLDVTSAHWMWELFQARRQEGTTIIFMSADLDELLERSSQIAVFSGGVMSQLLDPRKTNVDQLGHLIGGKHG